MSEDRLMLMSEDRSMFEARPDVMCHHRLMRCNYYIILCNYYMWREFMLMSEDRLRLMSEDRLRLMSEDRLML